MPTLFRLFRSPTLLLALLLLTTTIDRTAIPSVAAGSLSTSLPALNTLSDPSCDITREWCEHRYRDTNLTLDSSEYEEVLSVAIDSLSPSVEGASVEIGCRGGGSSAWIMDALANSHRDGQNRRVHLAIDPYGDQPYLATETRWGRGLGYNNHMRDTTLVGLYQHALAHGHDFLFFPLEDTEFFERYADGVPHYKEGGKQLLRSYAFVFFDGPHALAALQNEVAFFHDRSPLGAVWVFDDVVDYPHDVLDLRLRGLGWEVIVRGKTRKAAYIKRPPFVRSDKGQYCRGNNANILAHFLMNQTVELSSSCADQVAGPCLIVSDASRAGATAALCDCESFCRDNEDCTVCSVDWRITDSNAAYLRWVALRQCGGSQFAANPIGHWQGLIVGDVSRPPRKTEETVPAA